MASRKPRLDPRAALKEQRRAVLRETTRTAILEAARSVLLRDGVHATTLDAIAAELGLTKQGLYYHFRSKENLLLDLCLHEWTASAEAVHAATSTAASAADALEALARTYFARYARQLELFRLVTQAPALRELALHIGPAELARVRPINDRFYGPTEQKLARAQREGEADPTLHPRRLAFLAHTSTMGLLAMKLMVESQNDPLRHGDEALLDELCRTLRAAVRPPLPRKPKRSPPC